MNFLKQTMTIRSIWDCSSDDGDKDEQNKRNKRDPYEHSDSALDSRHLFHFFCSLLKELWLLYVIRKGTSQSFTFLPYFLDIHYVVHELAGVSSHIVG